MAYVKEAPSCLSLMKLSQFRAKLILIWNFIDVEVVYATDQYHCKLLGASALCLVRKQHKTESLTKIMLK